MGYSRDVEISGDGTDSGYSVTSGYSGEYVMSAAVPNGMGMTSQYHNDLNIDSTSSHAAVLTYASHYAPAAPMLTTVPYCPPLVAEQPYIVQHGAVSYPPQQVTARGSNFSEPMLRYLVNACFKPYLLY